RRAAWSGTTMYLLCATQRPEGGGRSDGLGHAGRERMYGAVSVKIAPNLRIRVFFNIIINTRLLCGYFYKRGNKNYGGWLCLKLQGSAKNL
ncbi:hypothetical protein, partial [Salmonella enterica]|uniref:hypothetical protein n=1 Tax=Salmonella enterica TaxID=28901 RepID=UPI001C12C49A